MAATILIVAGYIIFFFSPMNMLFLPLLFIVAGYLVYRAKFKIDKEMFDKIVGELIERGDKIDRGESKEK